MCYPISRMKSTAELKEGGLSLLLPLFFERQKKREECMDQLTIAQLNAEKKARIVAALKADPRRSDRVIAAETKTSQPSTFRVRQELEKAGLIPFVDHKCRVRQEAKPAAQPMKPKEQKLSEVRQAAMRELVIDPARTDSVIAKIVGSKTSTIHDIREHLEKSGVIRKLEKAERFNELGESGAIAGGAKVKVPEGVKLSDQIMVGIDAEKGGATSEQAAEIIGINASTYTKAKGVVKLHLTEGLSQEDRELVNRSITMMDKTNKVAPYWNQLKPVALKVWGLSKDGRIVRGDKVKKKKIAIFDHALVLIGDTCARAEEVEVPILSDEARVAACDQLARAIVALTKLRMRTRKP